MQNRKGFTLIEILIVIVVMGILMAMMAMSSSEAKLSADASNIVSKLRNIKTAAMQMYVEELDLWEGENDTAKDRFNMTEVKKFLNVDKGYDNFVIVQKAKEDDDVYAKREWYAGYNFDDNDTKLKTKLSGRAKDELLWTTGKLQDGNECTNTPSSTFSDSCKTVLMLIKKRK